MSTTLSFIYVDPSLLLSSPLLFLCSALLTVLLSPDDIASLRAPLCRRFRGDQQASKEALSSRTDLNLDDGSGWWAWTIAVEVRGLMAVRPNNVVLDGNVPKHTTDAANDIRIYLCEREDLANVNRFSAFMSKKK